MLMMCGCGEVSNTSNELNNVASIIEDEETEVDESEKIEESNESEDINEELEETVEEEAKNDNDIRDMSEDDFKSKCVDVTYEDMFNGDVPLIHEGECITYYGMVKDKRISDMMDSCSSLFFDGLYEYDDKFMYTGPQHKEGNGYVGHDVDVYFLKDDELADNDDIKIGSKIRVYGQVIMSDTRSYVVLAKYIDLE